jgi:hypothetical protein
MSDRARSANRHRPVRPNLEQLKRQAKELLRGLRRGDADAISEFKQYHPDEIAVEDAKLADAQRALTRSYSVSSWPRLVQACQLIERSRFTAQATPPGLWRGNDAPVLRCCPNLVGPEVSPKGIRERTGDEVGRRARWAPVMRRGSSTGTTDGVAPCARRK